MKHTFLTTSRGYRIAYHHKAGEGVGVIFCSGYRSDMSSTKATALAEWCAENKVPFTRFDYFAHGSSDGEFEEFTIGAAMEDTLDVIDQVVVGPQIIIGSSMGAWIALNAALERKNAIRGFIGIASAPDFTERLMVPQMTPEQHAALREEGHVMAYSAVTESSYPITRQFIEEARSRLLLDDIIGLEIPVHLFHGQEDADVPWETSLTLAKQIMGDEVAVTLIKDGDHRLSRPADLALVLAAVERQTRSI